MKKFFGILAAALLIAGCAKTVSYDDTFVMEKLANLEARVTALESSIQSIQSTLGSGKFVQKVQELTDEAGRTVGITVTYTTGEVVNFTISKVTDPDSAPVLSVMLNGAGELCWAIDGKILQKDGKDVLVYITPSFEIGEDGHLYVIVDGEKIDLGNVKGDKGEQGEPGKDGKDGKDGQGTVQDGIIKGIEVGEDSVVFTLENGTIELPLAKAFELVIEKTEYIVKSTDPIEIPYTVKNATENTVVDVFYGSEIKAEVKDGKIVATPASAKAEGLVLAYADSKCGLTSIVKLAFEGEKFEITDAAASADVDYMVNADAQTLSVNAVSNMAFDVKPQADWISFVQTKAQSYVIELAIAANDALEPRVGTVNIVRAGTDELIQTITIAQEAKDLYTNLSKNGTANCYIVPAAGMYKFKAVKGNSEESVGEVASVEVLWETWNNQDEVTAGSIVASAEYEGGFVKFATPETYHLGNASIAAKDAAGVILWSWHIWSTDKTIEGSNYGYEGGKLVMNYNLGAVGELGTCESFGMQYQWGRKDPFIGGGSLGHSDLATYVGVEFTKTTDLLTNDQANQNPTLQYTVGSNGKDWLADGASDRWSEEKGVNDPCPVGWRVARSGDNEIFLLEGGTVADLDNYTFVANGVATFPFSGTLYYEGGKFDKSDTIYHLGDDYNTTTPKGWRVKSSSGSRTQVRKASGGALRCVKVD